MSRLLDATICPDCRGPLDPAATCTVCGLQVKGPLAQQLWNVMVTADRLVEQLRAAPVAAPPAPALSLGPRCRATRLPPRAPATGQARAAFRPPRSRWSCSRSAGCACWSRRSCSWPSPGACSGSPAARWCCSGHRRPRSVAVVLTRRALRGAAETFWLVVAGMLAIDLLGAQSAGLAGLDSLGWRGTGALVGGALLAMGTGVGLWARSQPVSRLFGAEGVAVIGGAVLCSTNVWFAANPAVACTIAIPLLARLTSCRCVGWCRSRRTAWAGWRSPPGWCCSGIGWDRAARDGHPQRLVGRPPGVAAASPPPSSGRSSCTCPGPAGGPPVRRRAPPSCRWSCWPTPRRPTGCPPAT